MSTGVYGTKGTLAPKHLGTTALQDGFCSNRAPFSTHLGSTHRATPHQHFGQLIWTWQTESWVWNSFILVGSIDSSITFDGGREWSGKLDPGSNLHLIKSHIRDLIPAPVLIWSVNNPIPVSHLCFLLGLVATWVLRCWQELTVVRTGDWTAAIELSALITPCWTCTAHFTL